MKLKKYFEKMPRGTAAQLARDVNITHTWLSLVANGHRLPSPDLCLRIESATGGKVTRADMMPKMFKGVRK